MSQRETALIYSADPEVEETFKKAFSELGLFVTAVEGDVHRAADDAGSWTFAPDFLVLDLKNSEDMVADLVHLAEHSPEADTDVIVVGASHDISAYRRLRSIGVSEYFDRPLDPQEINPLLEAMIVDRRERAKKIDPKKVMVCTSANSGAGASTVAHAIAWMAADSGKRVMLIDLDFVAALQYVLIGSEGSQGFADILRTPSRLDQQILERMLLNPRPNLSVLSEILERPDENMIKEDGLGAVLSAVRSDIDLVVLDLPRRPLVGKDMLATAHRLVVVSDETVVGLRGARLLCQDLPQLASRRIQLVVNKKGLFKDVRVDEDDFEDRVGEAVLSLPFDAKGPPRSLYDGRSFMTFSNPFAKAAREELAPFVLGGAAMNKSSPIMKMLLGR